MHPNSDGSNGSGYQYLMIICLRPWYSIHVRHPPHDDMVNIGQTTGQENSHMVYEWVLHKLWLADTQSTIQEWSCHGSSRTLNKFGGCSEKDKDEETV